ncbi:MAG: gluconate 2-dehydrogenase subunit 3 family protein [Acidimicrobiales bacterium]
MTVISRRQVLQRGGIATLGLLLPAELFSACDQIRAEKSPGRRTPDWLAFDDHEAAVVVEATARLIPGPEDEPSEAGHPGAREAGVVRYIDTMLGALSLSPAKVFAGGPFSDRAGSKVDDMATFIGLSTSEGYGWKVRLAGYRAAYSKGVVALDGLAGGDFLKASKAERDAALAKDPDGFMTLMFGHAIEGMYSVPEYGGNHDLVGWKDISFPGDVQPRGYTDSEVTDSDGPDRYTPDGVAVTLLALIHESSGK